MTLVVAIDIGGTFTDLVAYDDRTGSLVSSKSSTTPADLSVGIRNCLDKSRIPVTEAASFVHGSTIAINTVIEHKGVPTALVVTKGTRDVYKIGRGNRPEAYNLFFKRPEPLVPRHLTFEVSERLGPDGTVWEPFDGEQARSVAEEISRTGVEAVAVCFLHSWSHPGHEQRMGEILAKTMPDAYLTLSHQILREYGEYERISTSALNAYIGPIVRRYLESLERLLADRKFPGRLLIMQSNGGVMSPAVGKETPVAMLESGPVAGFIAAARVGELLGHSNVIALDMGGTTAKTSLVIDGAPRMAHGYHIGGYARGQPVMLPVVDTVEVGSGGGSIAWVDDVGSLQVGPRSAGADPGPICYGRGGTEPTITDANLVLGRLGQTTLLGGEMALDAEAAAAGLGSKIGERLGLSAVGSALAIIKIAVMKMSLAVREVSVERGYDPRDFALVAFGGAGPLHAVEVARELHIPMIIVPIVPGQFSAAGMLMADLKHDYVRTYYKELGLADFHELRRIVDGLIDQGRERLLDEGVPESRMEFRRFFEIRYAGQDFALPITVSSEVLAGGARDAVRSTFNESHERQFGYHDDERPVEIVNVRVTAVGRHEDRSFLQVAPPPSSPHSKGTRSVFFDSTERPTESPVYHRDKLSADNAIGGPAVIEEYGSTTILFPGDSATVAPTGELLIRVGGAAT